MRRNDWNFIIDAAALAAFLLLLSTGILIRYVLPPGSGHSLALWGMDRHGWGAIHFWIAVAFLVLMAVHLVLHWSWIACMIHWRRPEGEARKAGRSPRIAITLILLFLVALLSLVPFFGKVKSDGTGSHEDHERRGGGRGRMEHRQER